MAGNFNIRPSLLLAFFLAATGAASCSGDARAPGVTVYRASSNLTVCPHCERVALGPKSWYVDPAFSMVLDATTVSRGVVGKQPSDTGEGETVILFTLTEDGMESARALLGVSDSSMVAVVSDSQVISIAAVVRDSRVIILRGFTSDQDVRSAVQLVGAPTTTR